MIPFTDADKLHALYQRRKVLYDAVRDNQLEEYCRAVRRLLREIDADMVTGIWSDFLLAVRRYRFDVLAAPLRFSADPISPRISDDNLSRIRRTVDITNPGIAQITHTVIDLLRALRERTDAPLLDNLSGMIELATLRDDTRVAVILLAGRLLAPTRDVLAERLSDRRIDVVTPSSLRGGTIYDTVVVIGPTRWFPDYVFDAPRTPVIKVLSYAWNSDRWHPARFFLAQDVVPPNAIGVMIHDLSLEESEANVDIKAIERKMGAVEGSISDTDLPDLTPARLYLLDGGEAVFLEATGRKTTMVIDLEAEERRRVRHAADADIEPGMFVVLRTDSRDDYIVPVANKILGAQAQKYRQVQTFWKGRLRDEVHHCGSITNAAISLLDMGSERANEQNLRSWMSERNIAPQDFGDFAAIMNMIGVDAERSTQMWDIARKIRNAHLRAGALISRRLVAQVRETSLNEFERSGRVNFVLPEVMGGRLTAFRVEGRANTMVLLPSGRLEQVFDQGV